MPHTIFTLIVDFIKIIFIAYSVKIVQNERREITKLGVCYLLYLPGFFMLEDISWKGYIIKNIYLLVILILCFYEQKMRISECISLICALFSVSEVLKILAAISGSVSMILLDIDSLINDTVLQVLSIIYMVAFISFTIYIVKRKIVNLRFSFSKKCIAYLAYVVIVFGKIPFLYTELRDAYTTKLVFIAIFCCTVIFFIISKIERHNAEMERAKIEENNKELSTKLHKSQEIIPAVVQVLSDVAESSGKEMEEQKTQKLLNEMTDLFGRQLKENSKEDLHLKNFCSTGLTVLDHQLKGYQMEAIDRGVNLDIYVQAPINDIIKRNNIDQLKLQRAVGDLIRNAFRVIINEKRSSRTNGHILLIIGCQYEGILEIAVVDNGAQFPLHVIETFGRRGVTTGGTGNGLADLVEFAEETKATICVEEFDGKTDSFTKKISMIFDKQRENIFISPRWEQVNSSFWKKLNIDL